jgi:maltose O-acetyltransferase
MLSGELYDPEDAELAAERVRARELLRQLSAASGGVLAREKIYASLFGSLGESLLIEAPFFCDYGSNIHIGDRVFFNFNCVVLDPAEVRIGNDVFFGPAVQIYTATHPTDWRIRRRGLEFARPITIESDVWIGGGAIIGPGVRIGERSVIGAGSVVTRDVPPGVVVAGSPARVLREVDG